MKALVKMAQGPGNMRLMEMPDPDLRPGHVIIEVEAAGICGTDLHIESAEYPCNPPVILGHEFSGVVVAAAPDVTMALVGQRVTSLPYFTTCGHCRYCRDGEFNLCAERKSAGSGTHGAFARYVLMPERSVRGLPDNIDFIAGAATEPLACVCRGLLEKGTVRPSDVVVVTGPGTIGLLAAQVAMACGATVVIAGTSADGLRMALARELGIHHTVEVDTQSPHELVMDLTGGDGADVAVECSGAGPGIRMAYELVRKKAQFIQMGLFGRRVELDVDMAVMKEVEVHNSFATAPSSWAHALRLLASGKVRTRELVTDTLPLDRWEEAFQRSRNKQAIKAMLLPKL